MKTLLLLLILACTQMVLAQPDTFSAGKKTILLSTGITLHYIDAGDPHGRPVVLLHGYTDSGRSFQPTIDELLRLDSTLRIIVPDLRGHGGSSMPDSALCRQTPEACFTPADFAADVLALLDQLDIPQANITGHSMGSVVAQVLALQYPERVSSLVLIGTFVNGRESAVIRQFLLADLIEGSWASQLALRPGFHWPADAWAVTPQEVGADAMLFLRDMWVADPTADEAFIQAILGETAQVRLGAWIGAIKALGELDHREALKKLSVPTLILWATQDNMLPDQPDQEEVRAAFGGAAAANGMPVIYKTYGRVPLPASGLQTADLGHNLQWGGPEAVAADILAFIRTGFPETGLPYANPDNLRQVLIDREVESNILVWGRDSIQKK